MNRPSILCVDDEKIVLTSLKEQLKRAFGQEFDIETVESGEEALEIFEDLLSEDVPVPLIITDHIMPGMKGDELLIEIHQHHPDIRKVLLTGQADADAVGNAVNHAGLYRYIAKPWEQDDLILTTREATRSFFQSKRLKEQEAQFQSLVESLNVGVFRMTDGGGEFLQVNPAIAHIFGYDSVGAFMQTRMFDLFEDPEEAKASVTGIRQQGYCKDLEVRMKKKDGTSMWASLSVSATFHEKNGQPPEIRWMDGVIEDVTERKLAKERLICLNRAYQRFVPHEFLKTLGKEDITDVELNDQVQKRMSILFSDIRHFSTLSESMTPEDNFRFINSYLSHMGPLVREYHGFIDKYIGDAIMALFDREAEDALNAAIIMLVRLSAYNMGRKRAGYHPIEIGIGINTGSMILGTLGEQNRMEGTVISDAVNAASRLEGLTKQYGVPLVISEHTYHDLKNPKRYAIRFIDRVRVKGKSEPIAVFEVFDTDPTDIRRSKLLGLKRFERALYHYHFGDLGTAHAVLQQYVLDHPTDTIAKVYLGRCDALALDHDTPSSYHVNRLVWRPDLEIGHDEIDAQHRQMFETITRLMEIICHDQGETVFFESAAALKRLAVDHVKTEEAVMCQINYPGYAAHKQLHQKYKENYDQFYRLVEQEGYQPKERGLNLLLRIQHLLAEWFVSHVSDADKDIINYL